MAGHKNTLGFNSRGGQQVAALAVDSQDGTLGVLPSAGSVIQAGAFGAAFSGVTTGIADTMKVRDGEMTHQEAVHDIAKSSLQGAATMATASTIAHMARTNPVLGLGVLALAGLGLWASGRKKPQRTNPEPPDPA